MAELGAISRDDALSWDRQLWLALGAALCLHLFLAFIAQVNFRAVTPLTVPPAIEVRLIAPPTPSAPLPESEAAYMEAPVIMPEPTAREPEAAAEPLPDLEPDTEPKSEPSVAAPPVSTYPPSILNSESGTTRGAFPEQSLGEGKDYVPSQWALEPPLQGERLKGLGLLNDADCLRSLSEDCAALRKEVFAEFELTEMEKVWTPARADTGMSSEFYGLSEREIRLKIGSKIAGENGFMLLPGIGIDGSLWDMLHGVKKGCEMKRGINSEGRYDVVRVCPDSLPAARDRKYYIPPKE